MAVPEQIPYKEYTANGVTTSFDLEFDCDKSEYLIVTLDGEEAPVGSWNFTGTTINFLSAPKNGVIVGIIRNTPLERTTDYQLYNNSFKPKPVNKDFDLIWWKLQELGVTDWLLGKKISDLKLYVDEQDNELRAFLLNKINEQGVALEQLEAYYEYIFQRLAEISAGHGWDASFIADGDETQKQINDKTVQFIPTVAQLLTYKPRKDGQLVVVKSYTGLNKEGGGKFVFKLGDSTTINNVDVFSGIGGRWFRYNWKNPDIFDAGLDGSESDVTAKFQALVNAATNINQAVNLRWKTVKITQLDIPDNMHLCNGVVDVTASTWQNTYGRAALMLKNTNRNAAGVDYELQANYLVLVEAKNIKFVNINFKSDSYAGIFYKFDGLQFINCTGNWNTLNMFKFVGGWNGTPLINDTPTSYNLVDPINGRCKNILIKDSKWYGGYVDKQWSSPFRFIACEDAYISGGKNDSPLGWHIDIYNKGFTLDAADYVNTNQDVVLAAIDGTGHADTLAVYVGQNSYDINILGGRWKDFGLKGAYIESGSQVTIDGVVVRCTNPNSVATFVDLQPQWRNLEKTFWGNVADVTIKNNVVNGVRLGVVTSQFGGVRSLKGIHIENNLISTNANLSAITITGTEDYTVANNNCNGGLYLGRNNGGGSITKNRFLTPSNYALYIDRQLTGILPVMVNNDFYVNSGDVIYNNAGDGKLGQIAGGSIQSGNGGHVFSLGEAGNISCYGFENGLTQRQISFSQVVDIPANSSVTYTKNIAGVKEGWTASMSVHGVFDLGYDLNIVVSCKSNQIVFKIRNNTASAVSANPNLLLNLNPFADHVFLN